MSNKIPKPKIVSLSPLHIQREPSVQSRKETNQHIVNEYADAMYEGAEFPPAIVYFDGTSNWLADGFKRHMAAIQAKKKLLCEVRQGTRRDAKLFSVGANDTNGERRKNEDKRRAVEMMLLDPEIRLDTMGKPWSDNAIAKWCKVSNHLVADMKESLGEFQVTERSYTTKQGGISTMETANIGAKSSSEPDESDFDEDVPLDPPKSLEEHIAEEENVDYPPVGEVATSEPEADQPETPAPDESPSSDVPPRPTQDAPPPDDPPSTPEPTLEEKIRNSPLALALACYKHSGELFVRNALTQEKHAKIFALARRAYEDVRYTTGPISELVIQVSQVASWQEWEGCAACKGSTRVSERNDPCPRCKGGFTIHRAQGVTPDVVRAHADSLTEAATD